MTNERASERASERLSQITAIILDLRPSLARSRLRGQFSAAFRFGNAIPLLIALRKSGKNEAAAAAARLLPMEQRSKIPAGHVVGLGI